MSKVTFPLTGHSYSDDGSSDHDMLNGGHAEHLLPMIGETVDTAQSAIDAAASAAQSKASAADAALSTRQDAGDAKTARQDAQLAATQAKNWAATVNVPLLVGKAGFALFANDDESGMVWRRAVRSGGGANQTDAQVYFGQDRTNAARVRVTLNTTDLGLVVTDTDLNTALGAQATALQNAINTKADAAATTNALNTKANQSDLNNTNQAMATKASQDALNVTNNTVAGKANAGARVQWDSGVVDFGVVSDNGANPLPAPYVVCGLSGGGAATANAIRVYGMQLRNQ
ncbi:hypothetical protein [Paraburkholderia lacunae]|uniref:hypothetical protein n=1 Tax=Paraburkholderia lacunae TaxID=2211104 RepID=UPI001FCBE4CE|nr:hypothetical protein [Paraburkholderia lacunae]